MDIESREDGMMHQYRVLRLLVLLKFRGILRIMFSGWKLKKVNGYSLYLRIIIRNRVTFREFLSGIKLELIPGMTLSITSLLLMKQWAL